MKIYKYVLDAMYLFQVLIFIPLFFHSYKIIKNMEKQPINEEQNKITYEERKVKRKILILIILMFSMLLTSLVSFIIGLF